MHQFTRVFGMTRVPGDGVDTLQQPAHASNHVAVLRRGAIFQVPTRRRTPGTWREGGVTELITLDWMMEAKDSSSRGLDLPVENCGTPCQRLEHYESNVSDLLIEHALPLWAVPMDTYHHARHKVK
eukprot:6162083-Pleurochrysis_carterae.AAC.1